MNRAILVNYNLHRPGQTYGPVIKVVKASGTYCHLGGSVWVTITTFTAAQLRDAIWRVVDANDEVICLDVSNDDWATAGYSQELSEWLQKHLVQSARLYR